VSLADVSRHPVPECDDVRQGSSPFAASHLRQFAINIFQPQAPRRIPQATVPIDHEDLFSKT